MTTYVVIERKSQAEVYRYNADEPVEWTGMEFATHDHVAELEPVVEATPTQVKVWSRVEFLRRFKPEERIAIRTAAKQSPALDDFMFLLEAASEVHSDHEDVAGGLKLLEAAKLIGPGRAQEIMHD